jgi:SpoIID/LytB domain protein
MTAPRRRVPAALLLAAALGLAPASGAFATPDDDAAAPAGTVATTDASTSASTDATTSAIEVYPRPADGVWEIEGHGYGHGIGMSQWGAQGAATQGLTSAQILSFYYPGTRQAAAGNPTLRIQITAMSALWETTLWAPAGQSLRVTANGSALPVPSGGRLTVIREASGYRLQHRAVAGGTVGWETTTTAAPMVSTGDGVVVGRTRTGDGVWYRGQIQVSHSGANVLVVNHVPQEDYLRAVVPRESPAYWEPAALQAQAVAARSYARFVATPGAAFDLCDTTSCQVYSGRATVTAAGTVTPNEHARTDAAIAATATMVLQYPVGGTWQVAFTQFSSSNGGYSVAGSRPYLVAQADPYSGSAAGDTVSTWHATLTASSLDSRCGAGDRVRSIQVTSRDGRGALGGRITGLRLECGTGFVELTTELARRLGMRSSWWAPESDTYPSTFYLNDTFSAWANHEVRLGRATSEPLAGDFDGDGIDTVGVRDGNVLTLAQDHTGSTTTTLAYGRAGDELFVGDWDGNGTDTFAVRRGNTFYIRNSLTSGPADTVIDYGRAGDEVFVGDWNGDGRDTLAVRRGNTFFIANSLTSGPADTVIDYGRAGDEVFVGDWNGDGRDTLAVRRGKTYFIANTLAGGPADTVLDYGRAGDTTVVGDWDGNGTDTLGVHRVIG